MPAPSDPADKRHDLAGQLTDRVETIVEAIRDRSVRPVRAAVRWIVLGSALAVVGTFALIAIGIGVLRLFDNDVFNNRVWATDLLFGGMLTVGGVFLCRKGRERRDDEQ